MVRIPERKMYCHAILCKQTRPRYIDVNHLLNLFYQYHIQGSP